MLNWSVLIAFPFSEVQPKKLMCFSITVDNTYDNIDSVVESQPEEEYEPEETYIIPNCPASSGAGSHQSASSTPPGGSGCS